MAWLIEAYLEEEMKTANDFYKKSHENFVKKNADISRVTSRHEKIHDERMNDSKNRFEEFRKNRKDEAEREPHLTKSKVEGIYALASDDPKESMKHSQKALDHIDKAADVYRKRDAIIRHNRRHPEKKAVNESVDMLVEMM